MWPPVLSMFADEAMPVIHGTERPNAVKMSATKSRLHHFYLEGYLSKTNRHHYR